MLDLKCCEVFLLGLNWFIVDFGLTLRQTFDPFQWTMQGKHKEGEPRCVTQDHQETWRSTSSRDFQFWVSNLGWFWGATIFRIMNVFFSPPASCWRHLTVLFGAVVWCCLFEDSNVVFLLPGADFQGFLATCCWGIPAFLQRINESESITAMEIARCYVVSGRCCWVRHMCKRLVGITTSIHKNIIFLKQADLKAGYNSYWCLVTKIGWPELHQKSDSQLFMLLDDFFTLKGGWPENDSIPRVNPFRWQPPKLSLKGIRPGENDGQLFCSTDLGSTLNEEYLPYQPVCIFFQKTEPAGMFPDIDSRNFWMQLQELCSTPTHNGIQPPSKKWCFLFGW